MAIMDEEFRKKWFPERATSKVPAGSPTRIRSAEASVWTADNPILKRGEPGYATDTNEYKIGDGVSTWTQLTAVAGGSGGGGGGGGIAPVVGDQIIPNYEIVNWAGLGFPNRALTRYNASAAWEPDGLNLVCTKAGLYRMYFGASFINSLHANDVDASAGAEKTLAFTAATYHQAILRFPNGDKAAGSSVGGVSSETGVIFSADVGDTGVFALNGGSLSDSDFSATLYIMPLALSA